MNKEEAGSCRSSVLVLSLCRVHGRERPVWPCGVVEWFGRPPNEQPVAWSDSWSHVAYMQYPDASHLNVEYIHCLYVGRM